MRLSVCPDKRKDLGWGEGWPVLTNIKKSEKKTQEKGSSAKGDRREKGIQYFLRTFGWLEGGVRLK